MSVDLIVDGNSLYARSFFAAVRESGKPNIERTYVFFLKTLLGLTGNHGDKFDRTPTRLLICWDGKPKKDKQRGPKPEGWHEGLFNIKPIVAEVIGGAQVISELEADDACASAAYHSARDPQVEHTFVASGDKDLTQVVDCNTSYYCLNEKCVISSDRICEKYGVKKPIQVAVMLAIIGDAGDQICGVNKWGKVKARKLFEQVTDAMDIMDVAQFVVDQIPEAEVDNFNESLELTLLNINLPSPVPQNIIHGNFEVMQKYGLAQQDLEADFERFTV